MNIYQEAVNGLKFSIDFYHKNPDIILNCEDSKFKILQELIDKQDKYRWHNLIKDPADLPKTFDTCILVTPDNEYVITRYFVDEDIWEYDYSSGSDNIAWKYIEEFKNE